MYGRWATTMQAFEKTFPASEICGMTGTGGYIDCIGVETLLTLRLNEKLWLSIEPPQKLWWTDLDSWEMILVVDLKDWQDLRML
jgi:hypothetical protein